MTSSDEARPDVRSRVRTISDSLRLLPVVELEPGVYGSAPQPSTSPWPTEEGDAYWRACLRVGGVVGVNPVVPGSWLVALDALDSAHVLYNVLRVHFIDGVLGDLDEIGPLCGGFALVDGNEILVLPTCCGDLANLDNWQTAAEQRSNSPEMLWIGHPWLETWYHAPVLHIREVDEYDDSTDLREFAVLPEALQRAVHQATLQIDIFYERVVASLQELPGVFDARAIGRALVGRRDS